MIDKLYEIAKLEYEKVSDEEQYTKFLDPFGKGSNLFLIKLEQSNSEYTYLGIERKGLNDENIKDMHIKVLKILTKGAEPGPCASFNFNKNKEQTFFDKLTNFFEGKINEKNISDVLKKNKDNIISYVKSVVEEGKINWITIQIDDKFVYCIEPIREKIEDYILVKNGLKEGFYNKGVCYFCHEDGTELVSIFKMPKIRFYTLDKKENISLNLKGVNEYRMLPVCINCQEKFDMSFSNKLLTDYNTFFYGQKFLLIPHLIKEDKQFLNETKEKIKRYNSDYKDIKSEIKAMSKLKKDLKQITQKKNKSEKDLEEEEKLKDKIEDLKDANTFINKSEFGILSNFLENQLVFSLILYEPISSQFIIYDVIEDTSKTRISEIADIHGEIIKDSRFIDNIDLIYFYKALLKYQFDENSKDINKQIKQQFMEFIKSVLLSDKLANGELIKLFMNYIHKEYFKKGTDELDSFLFFETKKFTLLLDFLRKIKCLEE